LIIHWTRVAGPGSTIGSGMAAGGGERLRPLAPQHSAPLNCAPLPLGPTPAQHVPLQHRNSFCVSALSQSSLYSNVNGGGASANYSSLAACGIDPFTYTSSRLMAGVDDTAAEVLQLFFASLSCQRLFSTKPVPQETILTRARRY